MTDRKHLRISNDFAKNPPGLIFENKQDLIPKGLNVFTCPDDGGRGFSWLTGRPRFKYSKRRGRTPKDLERVFDYWLLKEKAKALFQKIDPQGFDFAECDVDLGTDDKSEKFWLCDVVRVLDGLDEKNSDVTVIESEDHKLYSLIGSRRLIFDDSIIRSTKIFRMKFSLGTIICNDTFMDECRNSGLKGVIFMPTVSDKDHN